MSASRAATTAPGATFWAGAALVLVAVLSWVQTVRNAGSMVMPASSPSFAEGAAFTLQWGVMMTAMMLPSAIPMVLMYRTVSGRLTARGEISAPVWLFAGVYLLAWMLPGIPLYLLHVGLRASTERWAPLAAATPYLVALTLAAAGAYQFTSAKHACLRACESPLGFLMRRWTSGYAATVRLAVVHAAYCLGCCWGLMAILVVAGAMSLPWTLAIGAVVFAEKLFPHGGRTARIVGAALLVLAAAVAAKPELARELSGLGASGAHMQMDMDMPM